MTYCARNMTATWTDLGGKPVAYFDANVLLEIALDRPHYAVAKQTFRRHAPYVAVSTLTGHLVMHFGVKRVGLDGLRSLLSDYQLLTLSEADFAWAYANRRNEDFEDALQLAVAIREGCEVFYTFDEGLYKLYRLLPQIHIKLLGKAQHQRKTTEKD